MPKNDHYIIIGNGPAGNRAAEVLRENDTMAKLTLISDEAFPFYHRHKLCEFISGKRKEELLKIRPYSDYKEMNIRMRLGQKVERIDPVNNILYLKHMEKVSFTKLILATGGKPRVLPSYTSFENYFSFMSTYFDALHIKPEIENAKNIVVLGGDLISIRFMKMLASMKKNVTFFMNRECFWPIALTQDMAEKLSSNLKKKNIHVIMDATLESITEDNGNYTLKTKKNDSLKADMIFCFMGLTPNISFIEGSGIDTERGILVDELLRTNYKDIYACGDCAQIYNPELKDYWVSIGWQNAGIQGEVAALNMLGDHKVIKPVPKEILQVEGIKVDTSWWKTIQA